MRMVAYVGLGVAAAVLAALLVGLMQFEQVGSSRSGFGPGASAKVVMAKRDLPVGHRIVAEDLVVGEIARSELDEGAVQSMPVLIGRVTTYPLTKGQVVRQNGFAPAGTGPEIAEMLSGGWRAITVSLSDPTVGVVLYPGALVDVLSTLEMPRGSAQPGTFVTTTVLRGIRVLAVDDQVVGGDSQLLEGVSQKRRRLTLTLLVSPEDAQLLELASARGSLAVTLRAPNDASEPENIDATLEELLKNSLVQEAPAVEQERTVREEKPVKRISTATEQVQPVTSPVQPVWQVRVVKDGEVKTHTFEEEAQD